ncbi:unnamed protein product [Musa acuminata subsp. malaccensis]|uniref:(wild Malaysian banana) hypothetical protein n=1 Tax=Musa acuminata subsp. malaccensis TaxID=214687 RepID=A0A804L5M6_MUSAM|nr:unnamed protein product [Musa acuminata subsp. malaccensis]
MCPDLVQLSTPSPILLEKVRDILPWRSKLEETVYPFPAPSADELSSGSMRSSRRSRSKARRPKYVSLRRHLAPRPPPSPADPSDMFSSAAADDDDDATARCHQLDLFPLQPEHLDRDPHVACLLDDRGGGGEPTLAALLGCGGGGDSSSEDEEEEGGDGDGLARRALRGRERWAYCRSSSSSSEEVASSAAEGNGGVDLWRCVTPQALALKLDYEEILAVWSDRGPLYMDGEGPQVVPQLQHPCDSAMLVEVGCRSWKVPEQPAEGKERSGMSREARVMRYKEKRRNRLFAKRIRYEVRKFNAEKRPRVKGRFVRRNDEDEDHS